MCEGASKQSSDLKNIPRPPVLKFLDPPMMHDCFLTASARFFELTPFPSLRAKAHKVIQEILPNIRARITLPTSFMHQMLNILITKLAVGTF